MPAPLKPKQCTGECQHGRHQPDNQIEKLDPETAEIAIVDWFDRVAELRPEGLVTNVEYFNRLTRPAIEQDMAHAFLHEAGHVATHPGATVLLKRDMRRFEI